MASYFEIDDVIDPADTRRWIATLFDDDHAALVPAAGQAPPEHRRLRAGERSGRAVRTGLQR